MRLYDDTKRSWQARSREAVCNPTLASREVVCGCVAMGEQWANFVDW